MSTELFRASAVAMDSPRLAWIKAHRVLTFHCLESSDEFAMWLADFDEGVYSYENAADYFFWRCGPHTTDKRSIGIGHTEDDAIAELCQKRHVKMWNEEGAR